MTMAIGMEYNHLEWIQTTQYQVALHHFEWSLYILHIRITFNQTLGKRLATADVSLRLRLTFIRYTAPTPISLDFLPQIPHLPRTPTLPFSPHKQRMSLGNHAIESVPCMLHGEHFVPLAIRRVWEALVELVGYCAPV